MSRGTVLTVAHNKFSCVSPLPPTFRKKYLPQNTMLHESFACNATDPNERDYQTWPATTPPPRRLLLGILSSGLLVLTANFLGITSAILGIGEGEIARKLRLDALYPVQGFKRCIILNEFEFIFPTDWLEDITLYKRRAEQAEFNRGLAFQDFDQMERVARRVPTDATQPVVALGPPGGSGVDNISVISAPSPGLDLDKLGEPVRVGDFLMSRIAPQGSNKRVELLSAVRREDENGTCYFVLEYRVQMTGKAAWQRHNIAVLSIKNGQLYTFNAQCSEENWSTLQPIFNKAASSFLLLGT